MTELRAARNGAAPGQTKTDSGLGEADRERIEGRHSGRLRFRVGRAKFWKNKEGAGLERAQEPDISCMRVGTGTAWMGLILIGRRSRHRGMKSGAVSQPVKRKHARHKQGRKGVLYGGIEVRK